MEIENFSMKLQDTHETVCVELNSRIMKAWSPVVNSLILFRNEQTSTSTSSPTSQITFPPNANLKEEITSLKCFNSMKMFMKFLQLSKETSRQVSAILDENKLQKEMSNTFRFKFFEYLCLEYVSNGSGLDGLNSWFDNHFCPDFVFISNCFLFGVGVVMKLFRSFFRI
jgi:hypothetical protein